MKHGGIIKYKGSKIEFLKVDGYDGYYIGKEGFCKLKWAKEYVDVKTDKNLKTKKLKYTKLVRKRRKLERQLIEAKKKEDALYDYLSKSMTILVSL